MLMCLSLLTVGAFPTSALANDVIPIAECVTKNNDGTYTATFGYNNKLQTTKNVPVGEDNQFWPNPVDRHQPTSFAPGVHTGVLTVTFTTPGVTWYLEGNTATAAQGDTCGPPPCETSCNEIPEVPSHLVILGGAALLLGGAGALGALRRRRKGQNA